MTEEEQGEISRHLADVCFGKPITQDDIQAVRFAPAKGPLPEAVVRRVRQIWNAVPALNCKGLCSTECEHVPVQPIEALYLIELHGAKVDLTMMKDGDHLFYPALGRAAPCEFLKGGRCSIYEDRPLACRLYGHGVLGVGMTCPHGCGPDPRRISEAQALALEIAMMAAGLKDLDQMKTPPREIADLVQLQTAGLPKVAVVDGEEVKIELGFADDDGKPLTDFPKGSWE